MKHFSISAIALLVLVSACSVSSAQRHYNNSNGQPTMGQEFKAGYHANVYWPRHYIPPARRSVSAAYEAMINNGWRRQTLLGDYHFNKDTNELTSAGKLKVNWIFSQAPVNRRTVFVQRGREALATDTRIASVHDYAGNMSPAVGPVNVRDTHIVAEGHSAAAVDNVFVGYQANRLPPVLPASSGGGASE